jgi:hypothetical protein
LSNRAEIVAATAAVANELAREKPNKVTVSGILTGIAEGVKSVGTIASAVDGLRRAVGSFL